VLHHCHGLNATIATTKLFQLYPSTTPTKTTATTTTLLPHCYKIIATMTPHCCGSASNSTPLLKSILTAKT
jgi:hypothetical protein